LILLFRGSIIEESSIFSDEDIVKLKRHILALKRSTLPPVVTHNMVDGFNDAILSELRRLNLYNSPSDRVKIVFHPEFLSSDNPVLGMEYEEFVRGCHLGVFPSYYEPWGYTPAECTLMGIPSITTNLSGFGSFIEDTVECPSDYGIYIVDRRMKSIEESCNQLGDYLFQFCQKSRRQRINQRNRTERLSDILDWRRMGMEYQKARFCALDSLAYRLNESEAVISGSVKNMRNLETVQKIPRPLSAPPSPRMKNIEDYCNEFNPISIEKLKIHEQVEIDDKAAVLKVENVI
jgi:glycogen synthase